LLTLAAYDNRHHSVVSNCVAIFGGAYRNTSIRKERMPGFIRRIFRRKNPDPYFEAERLPAPEPEKCPTCASRIVLNEAGTLWMCVGLKDRAEVEKYLGPEFPKGKVPAAVVKKDLCGWSGKPSDFGKLWV